MKALALAPLVLLGCLAAASANAAEATSSVNVRSGPGASYKVVDRLFRGEDVNVRRCRSNGWCFITHPGPDGWVSARYLVSNNVDDEYLGNRRPRPNISFSIILGGGGFGGGPGGHGPGNGPGGGQGPGGGNGPDTDLVCLVTFFDESDVAAGADANVESAQVLPRSEAEARDRPNDRRAIFDYGTNRQTRETCAYLDRLN